jgi:hypothetical protein
VGGSSQARKGQKKLEGVGKKKKKKGEMPQGLEDERRLDRARKFRLGQKTGRAHICSEAEAEAKRLKSSSLFFSPFG